MLLLGYCRVDGEFNGLSGCIVDCELISLRGLRNHRVDPLDNLAWHWLLEMVLAVAVFSVRMYFTACVLLLLFAKELVVPLAALGFRDAFA